MNENYLFSGSKKITRKTILGTCPSCQKEAELADAYSNKYENFF